MQLNSELNQVQVWFSELLSAPVVMGGLSLWGAGLLLPGWLPLSALLGRSWLVRVNMCIYIYVYVYMCIYAYVYIHIGGSNTITNLHGTQTLSGWLSELQRTIDQGTLRLDARSLLCPVLQLAPGESRPCYDMKPKRTEILRFWIWLYLGGIPWSFWPQLLALHI